MTAPRKRARLSGTTGRPSARSNDEGGGAAFEVPSLPADFDGVPLDGGQYLALVRQEARRHAPVYRLAADHPYMLQARAPAARRASSPATAPGVLARDLPVPADGVWHTVYTANFRAFRDRVSGATPPHSAKRRIGRAQAELPGDPNNEGLWFAWLHGFRMRDKDSEPVAGAQARRPSMVLLAALEHADKLFLLEAMSGWIDLPAAQDEVLRARLGPGAVLPPWLHHVSDDEGHASASVQRAVPSHLAVWMFALLASLSPHLDSDETSMLRQLVRAVAQGVKASRQRTLQVLEDRRLDSEGNEDAIALLAPRPETKGQSAPSWTASPAREAIIAQARAAEACAWMIIASIIDVWRQTDLWDEIRSTLMDL